MEPVFSHSIAAKWTSSSGQLVVSPPWVPAKASNQPRSVQIDSVTSVDELNIPPGNRLEVLKGDRAGQHSIRITDDGAFVSGGRVMAFMTRRLSITTKRRKAEL